MESGNSDLLIEWESTPNPSDSAKFEDQGLAPTDHVTTDADFFDALMNSGNADTGNAGVSSRTNPSGDEFQFFSSDFTQCTDKPEYKESSLLLDFDPFSPVSATADQTATDPFTMVNASTDQTATSQNPLSKLELAVPEKLGTPEDNKSQKNAGLLLDFDSFDGHINQLGSRAPKMEEAFSTSTLVPSPAEQAHVMAPVELDKEESCSNTEERLIEDSSFESVGSGQGSNEGEGQGQVKSHSRKRTEKVDRKEAKMSQRARGNLNRSMEKSFEDLLTGLESDGEPDIDDIINNCDLPEHVTDATFNALASENKKSYEQQMAEQRERNADEEDEAVQLPRKGSQVRDEDDTFEKSYTNGNNFDISGIEKGSFFSDEEDEHSRNVKHSGNDEHSRDEEHSINDDPGVHSPKEEKEDPFKYIGERVADFDEKNNEVEGDKEEEDEEEENVYAEESEEKEDVRKEEEDSEDEQKEDMKKEGEQEDAVDLSKDTINLTSTSMTFQGLDHDDSDPDIDALVENCVNLPENVTDATINFMVQTNKPLARSYRESEELGRTPDVVVTDTREEEEVFNEEKEGSDEEKDESQKDPTMDFAMLEDTSHLDVDIGKEKVNLRKKGSLAKRRKPTRESVRSGLLSGDESVFQDSSGGQENGQDEKKEQEGVDQDDAGLMSPPAKRPSPNAVALPALTPKPRPSSQRLSRGSEEEDMNVDNTPKKDFRNIGVKLPVPQRRSLLSEGGQDQEGSTDNNFTFEKPTLKKVERPSPGVLKSPDSDKCFDVPALKSVPREGRDRKPSDAESDKTFSKPSLKTVPKRPGDVSAESEMRFEKPSLRAVSVERSESGKSEEPDKTFAKPALKTAPKPYLDKPTTPKSPEAKTFEIPHLRRTPKVERDHQVGTSETMGHFDKPSLRNVSHPHTEEKSAIEQEAENRHRFDKPALRTVPKDQLPTQTLRVKAEPEVKKPVESDEKHKFDMPTLRNVSRDVKHSDASQNTAGEVESLSKFRAQLRATPRKEVPKSNEGEKGEGPSWLREMKLKRTKSQSEDINDIENQNRNNESKPPPTCERERPRKSSNSLPLQETSDLRSNLTDGSRRKHSSSIEGGKNGDISHDRERRTHAARDPGRDQYTPSWLKTKDSAKKTNPNLNFVSPANGETSDLPTWKRELAERRRSRMNSDTPMKTPGEEKAEPSWKQNFKLKPTTPSHAASSTKKTEPEWKQKAEEKRQRIIKSGLFDKTLRKTE